eukprot:6247455-Amphidinium_carterae.3
MPCRRSVVCARMLARSSGVLCGALAKCLTKQCARSELLGRKCVGRCCVHPWHEGFKQLVGQGCVALRVLVKLTAERVPTLCACFLNRALVLTARGLQVVNEVRLVRIR